MKTLALEKFAFNASGAFGKVKNAFSKFTGFNKPGAIANGLSNAGMSIRKFNTGSAKRFRSITDKSYVPNMGLQTKTRLAGVPKRNMPIKDFTSQKGLGIAKTR